MLSILVETNFDFQLGLESTLLPASAFNLDQSKILSLGKRLNFENIWEKREKMAPIYPLSGM